jgi:hypothetical protein
MWSHYTDGHKGVCLLYRFPESFLLDKRNKILGVDKVRYDSDALTNWLKTGAIDPSDPEEFVVELTKIFLTSKSPAWKYEDEVRIIRSEHGRFAIPGSFLEQNMLRPSDPGVGDTSNIQARRRPLRLHAAVPNGA